MESGFACSFPETPERMLSIASWPIFPEGSWEQAPGPSRGRFLDVNSALACGKIEPLKPQTSSYPLKSPVQRLCMQRTETVIVMGGEGRSYACMWAKLLQLCSTLCNPTDYNLLVSSVHGILQARILEWVAVPSSRGSSRPRDQTLMSYVSCIGRGFLYH